jgi:predicted short-subunit dehydrogenase-like oxidoreductase (DUF2520 family)
MNTFSIIGSGRLGTSLALALSKKEWTIRSLADKSQAAAKESRKIVGAGKASADWLGAAADASVLFLCIPDEEIEKTAARLARGLVNWRGKVVFHTSGILSSKILEPLRRRGASVASFHPIQSFSSKRTPANRFKNIYYGVEGDSQALSLAKKIARRLGGRTLLIKPQDKPLYHAACSMASNLFVPLLDLSCELLRAAGIKGGQAGLVLFPLVEGTLQNVKHLDVKTALTGPIARGDEQTVKRHIRALRKFPEARRVYQILGGRALQLAKKKRIPASKIRALKRRLEEK